NSGLHFLSIPFSKVFADYYAVSELTSKEYPGLVPEGHPVETLGAPAVPAVYNWPQGSDRYRRVERFTEALFNKWGKFREPPYHPKWRDVNLAATVPGWTRWSVAEEMLQRLRQANAKANAADGQPAAAAAAAASAADFTAFLKDKGVAGADP